MTTSRQTFFLFLVFLYVVLQESSVTTFIKLELNIVLLLILKGRYTEIYKYKKILLSRKGSEQCLSSEIVACKYDKEVFGC